MHLTDTGNAERLVARHRHEIRYCAPRKRWLIYDGQRWAWDQKGSIEQKGKQTIRSIYSEAQHAKDEEQAKAIASHAARSEQSSRRAAMIALAQSEPGIPVVPSELDADPWAFNVANGTINLRTGQLRPHAREDLITKIAEIEFVPGAQHALWERYLRDATGGDSEMAAYLQCMAGYSLYGAVSEKAFWFLFGPPDGMKSTFIDALTSTLGDYAVSADFSTWLVQTNTGGNRGDVVALLGARLVSSVEVRRGAKFDEAMMKRVTGGDALTASAKYETEITFMPSFALWLAANDAPAVRDDDEGFWRRVRRIPFVHVLPKERQDPAMRDKLRAPDVQQAILAWAVEGCLHWQRSGFPACAAVERSTAQYREEMDRVAGFFADCCVFEDGAELTVAELRDAYEGWCRENGVRTPITAKDMAERLRAKQCKQGKVTRARGWHGVRLLRDFEEPRGTRGTDGTSIPETFSREREVQNSQEQLSHVSHASQLDAFDEMERDAVQAEGRGRL